MKLTKEKLQQIIKEELENAGGEETSSHLDPEDAVRFLTNATLSSDFGTALLDINKMLNAPASDIPSKEMRKGFAAAFNAASTSADQVVVAAMKRIWGERET